MGNDGELQKGDDGELQMGDMGELQMRDMGELQMGDMGDPQMGHDGDPQKGNDVERESEIGDLPGSPLPLLMDEQAILNSLQNADKLSELPAPLEVTHFSFKQSQSYFLFVCIL